MSADLDGKNKVDEKTDLTVFMEPERDQIFCRMILFLLLMWNDVETVVLMSRVKD